MRVLLVCLCLAVLAVVIAHGQPPFSERFLLPLSQLKMLTGYFNGSDMTAYGQVTFYDVIAEGPFAGTVLFNSTFPAAFARSGSQGKFNWNSTITNQYNDNVIGMRTMLPIADPTTGAFTGFQWLADASYLAINEEYTHRVNLRTTVLNLPVPNNNGKTAQNTPFKPNNNNVQRNPSFTGRGVSGWSMTGSGPAGFEPFHVDHGNTVKVEVYGPGSSDDAGACKSKLSYLFYIMPDTNYPVMVCYQGAGIQPVVVDSDGCTRCGVQPVRGGGCFVFNHWVDYYDTSVATLPAEALVDGLPPYCSADTCHDFLN